MKVKVWTVTTDGDNLGLETSVYGTEEKARAEIIEMLSSFGVARCKDGHRLESASLSELSELWEDAADGCCIIEEHEVETEAPTNAL